MRHLACRSDRTLRIPSAAALAVVGVLVTTQLTLGEPIFMGLGSLSGSSSASSSANAVSSDGSTIVGGATSSRGFEAFIWTRGGGMMPLGFLPGASGFSEAVDVSGDGTVVVGQSNTPNGRLNEAFRWSSGQMQGLGFLGGTTLSSQATGISADGNVIVGESTSPASGPNGGEAFAWRAAGGMQGLGDLPGGAFTSSAAAVSNDGTVIVGYSGAISPKGDAFVWTLSDGIHAISVPPGELGSRATAVSGDGTTIAVTTGDSSYLWRLDGSVVELGDFVLQSLSDDGMFGTGYQLVDETFKAIVWDRNDGVRFLQDVLTDDYGINLAGWELREARDVSQDGTVLVGYGINPSGHGEAWMAVIPEPGSLVLFAGVLAMLTRRSKARPRAASTSNRS